MSETVQKKRANLKAKGRRKRKSFASDKSTRVLIFGVLSLIIPIFGVFLGIVAVVLGIMYRLTGKEAGRLKVNIGLWMGVISFVITLLGLIFFVPLFVVL